MLSHDYPANALPQGYKIENYLIKDILGVGGFGITYLAEDVQLKTMVAIKEYLPSDLAVRGRTYTINPSKPIDTDYITLHPKSKADEENFIWGLERFLEEARTVANLKHPNIVQIKHFFEANNTAYFVMDYEQGEALNKLLKKGESIEEHEIYKLIVPLLDGLKKVHSENYLHRDISPSNIYIQDNAENPILIDFGAARQSLGKKSKSISTIVKIGYAPYEQYQTRGNQGPWSDIYAMGAVLYQLISGSIPVESTERVNAMVNNLPDPLSPAIKIGKKKYSQKLLRAIDWALQVREKDRPQNIEQWVVVLEGGKHIVGTKFNQSVNQKYQIKKSIQPLYLTLGLLGIICLLIAGVWFFSSIELDPVPDNSLVKPTINASSENQEKKQLSEKFLDCVGDGGKNCEQFK